MSMTFVVAPNTSGSDSFVSLQELPLAKIITQISQESNAPEAALSKSDCKSNTFFPNHQTFYKLF